MYLDLSLATFAALVVSEVFIALTFTRSARRWMKSARVRSGPGSPRQV
jgi:hypothetical protein